MFHSQKYKQKPRVVAAIVEENSRPTFLTGGRYISGRGPGVWKRCMLKAHLNGEQGRSKEDERVLNLWTANLTLSSKIL